MSRANESIAAEVRAALARAQIPNVAVAKAIDVHPGTASRKVNGRAPLTVEELLVIADLAGVDVAEFFADKLGAARMPETSAFTDVA
jgi:plasmid maintenance system antidote protein VapI